MTLLKFVENIVETSNKKAANTITSSVIKYKNEISYQRKIRDKRTNKEMLSDKIIF